MEEKLIKHKTEAKNKIYANDREDLLKAILIQLEILNENIIKLIEK